MDLLEDLSTTEREEIVKFLESHNSTLLDNSLTPLSRLTQISEIASNPCFGHCNCISAILHQIQTKLISAAYPSLHPHLLAPKDWPWSEQLREVVREAELGKKSNLLKEVSRDIFVIEMLPVDFCRQLLEEISHYESWCQDNRLSVHRPNSMNRYGAILDEFGFKQVFKEMTQYLRQVFIVLYGENIGSVDGHHGFVVEYEIGKDLKLGFHVDDSQVTINLCLGYEFTGGELWFAGVRCPSHTNTSWTPEEYMKYSHTPGVGVIHRGKHRHGATELKSGKRSNLIVWFRAEQERAKEDFYFKNKLCPDWCWYTKEAEKN